MIEVCSFCAKTKREVHVLVAATAVPVPVAICDECVGLCTDIVAEEMQKRDIVPNRPLPGFPPDRRGDSA